MKSFNLIKPYLIEKRLSLLLGLVCLIAVDLLNLCFPRVIKWAIDDLTTFSTDTKGLFIYALYITGLAAMIGITRAGWLRCFIGMAVRLEEGLRNHFFSHIQTLSASYFNKTKTGDLMAHATNDIQNVRFAVGMGIVMLIDSIFMTVASVGFMLYINVQLTVLVFIPMPFIVFAAWFFSRKMHQLYQDVQAAFSDMTEAVRERFAGIRIIKAYNGEAKALSDLEKMSQHYVDKNIGLVKITGLFSPLMTFFSSLSVAIVLCFGGRLAILSTITPGDFVAFITYLGLLSWPMTAMGRVINMVQRGKASLDRLDKIVQTHSEMDDVADAKPVTQFRERIVFRNVSFSYESNDDNTDVKASDRSPALSDISIELAQGKTLGIIGPPGSGKTSLLNLIPRFFEVSQGQILMDGTDIGKLRLRDLRSLISFMPQEPFLFAGTIGQNITFGDERISESDLIRAAEDAALYDAIQTFPKGFDTVVGEKGVVLSGGQKQRVALARSLIRETPILILDDPISQVDTETGSIIVDTLRAMKGRRTLIIVSHRLSAVRFADQIITLRQGEIEESGSPEQLMARDGYYAQTLRIQKLEEELYAS
ncbi:MAG: multidrug ABC transporter permease [Desulfobacteraceae bacterium 4572_88]|nr:MAG: multidrug ABC transporter permease [Desulfobacteraceae bacterium 4572_88]